MTRRVTGQVVQRRFIEHFNPQRFGLVGFTAGLDNTIFYPSR